MAEEAVKAARAANASVAVRTPRFSYGGQSLMPYFFIFSYSVE